MGRWVLADSVRAAEWDAHTASQAQRVVTHRESNGAGDSTGRWGRANCGTHIIGRVRVNVAVLEVDVAAADVDAPALPNEEGARIWSVPGKFLHWGAGVR